MKYNGALWWDNLYGPSSLINEIQKEVNNKKNVIISCEHEIPWIDYFFSQIIQADYNFMVDVYELDIDEISDNETILKKILKLNGIGYQYKGDKNSIKYLNEIDSEYMKLYYIKNLPSSREDQLVNLMKNMESNSKVLIIANYSSVPSQGGLLKVKKYNDYISVYDKIRFLKLVIQKSNLSIYMNEYIAELVGRMENSLVKAIEVVENYSLDETYNFEEIEDSKKKLVWESQLLVFFPLLEKKRNEFVYRHYDKIKLHLPMKDTFSNVYETPEELEIGHIMRLIKNNQIYISNDEKDQFEMWYDIRNKLAHQKIVKEDVLKKFK